jgi:hypothetical protein
MISSYLFRFIVLANSQILRCLSELVLSTCIVVRWSEGRLSAHLTAPGTLGWHLFEQMWEFDFLFLAIEDTLHRKWFKVKEVFVAIRSVQKKTLSHPARRGAECMLASWWELKTYGWAQQFVIGRHLRKGSEERSKASTPTTKALAGEMGKSRCRGPRPIAMPFDAHSHCAVCHFQRK